MKKLLCFIAVFSVLCLSAVGTSAADEAPQNSAASAVLIETSGGDTLYSKAADEPMLIASTTKIMTALVILERCLPEEEVEILPEYTGIEGSSIYLKPGDKLTVLELLYGMMLASGNDAATALACHAAGSIDKFAELMNLKASELGLKNTSFKNPHGLDAEGHYSTAAELAKISLAAMKNELFRKIVSTKSVTINGRTYTNHNKLLWQYEYAAGIKTGYTMSAGRILVSCAEKDGLGLICVTINDRDDWKDHKALYDWGFANYRSVDVGEYIDTEYEIPVISGLDDTITAKCEPFGPATVPADAKVECTLLLPRFLYAPVEKGQTVGELIVSVDGRTLVKTDIRAESGAERNEDTALSGLEMFIKDLLRHFGRRSD